MISIRANLAHPPCEDVPKEWRYYGEISVGEHTGSLYCLKADYGHPFSFVMLHHGVVVALDHLNRGELLAAIFSSISAELERSA